MEDEWKNKLALFKEESGMTWRVMQDITGLSATTLMKIGSDKSWDEQKQITLESYTILRDKLKVDLIN